jgi:AcrR family transcriptional regulator
METSDIAIQEAPTARGRKRREKIVDAASALFVANGFHATSIDEIGAAAGITGPGLYRHFAAKDEILLAALDRMWERLRRAIDRVQTEPPGEAFETLLDTHIDLAFEQGHELLLLVRC